MSPKSSPHLTVLLAIVACAGSVLGQEETITLQNGAVFRGRVSKEDERFLDLEIQNGRISLAKRWVQVRSHGPIAGRPAPGSGVERAVDATPRAPAEAAARDGTQMISLGAALLAPLGKKIEDFTTAAGSEELAFAFCRLVQEGRSSEALEQLADAESLLLRTFPLHAKGLTAYSRKLAARLLVRWFGRTLARPGFVESIRDAKLSATKLSASGSMETIEILAHAGATEPIRFVFAFHKRRLVECIEAPDPLGAAIRDLHAALRTAGNTASALIPVLETSMRGPQPGADSDPKEEPTKKIWTLRPHDKGCTLVLPWCFEPVRENSVTERFDALVHAPTLGLSAAARSEDLVLPLATLRDVFVGNVDRTGYRYRIEEEVEIKVDSVPGLRLTLIVTPDKVENRFEVVLIVAQGRTFQFALWSDSSRSADTRETIDSVLAGITFGN